MRITSAKELERLVKAGRISKSHNVDELKSAIAAGSRKSQRKNNKASCTWCAFPAIEPSARLYNAVVMKFGRYAEGGEVVHEMTAPFTGRQWALDMALPRWRIGIEMDGWQYHGKYKESFQRDRDKQTDFARYGWLIMRASNKQVNHSLDEFVSALSECVGRLQRYQRVIIKEKSFGRYECVKNPGG